MKIFTFLCVLFVAMLGFVMFYNKIYFPIEVSILIFAVITLFLYTEFSVNNLGIVFMFLWFIYALPFIHILSYIGFDFNSSPTQLWGLRVNPYMVDEEIVKLTAMIGAMGSLGIVFGSLVSTEKFQKNNAQIINKDLKFRKFMGLPMWIFWVSIGFVLTVVSSAEKSMFDAVYTESGSKLSGVNLDSAWAISYVILSFAFCDAILCPASYGKAIKTRIIIFVVFTIVVYYQLLRGDRESLPWLLGLLLVKYYWVPRQRNSSAKLISVRKLLTWTVLIFFLSVIVGGTRSVVAEAKGSDVINVIFGILKFQGGVMESLLHGTWSSSLLTPLSVAGDHANNLLAINYGKDYINFVLSVPPGIVCDALGYIRPIDGQNGPAHEMRYGLGGTHATVVPFMNFRIIGVFIIPAIWSHLINKIEKITSSVIAVPHLSVLTVLIMVIPHWLWYGEKIIISTAIIWCVTACMYRGSVYLN